MHEIIKFQIDHRVPDLVRATGERCPPLSPSRTYRDDDLFLERLLGSFFAVELKAKPVKLGELLVLHEPRIELSAKKGITRAHKGRKKSKLDGRLATTQRPTHERGGEREGD